MASAKKRESEKSQKEQVESPRRDGMRETFESIVIAFIFAFLFRTFEAEAFVIPTGSMAPTLMGRHKDETCPACGFEFTVGASGEINQETKMLRARRHRIETAICPNCHYTVQVFQDPVFVGDRILVTKFNYRISAPDRWDVTVFKYPEDPSTNYIKRLCGLPGETIEIRQGDLYEIDEGRADILRKQDLDKQIAVLQPVYDDDHPPRPLLKAGWPERWAAVVHDNGPENVAGWSREGDGWRADRAARTYHLAASDQTHWLRYRHFVPSLEDWENLGEAPLEAQARLVLDFMAYDTSDDAPEPPDEFFNLGVYWVGDLSIEATVRIEEIQPESAITFELVEGSRRYRCTLLPAQNEARLSYVGLMDRRPIDSPPEVISRAPIDLAEPGTYHIRFANVDNQLWLAIDGEVVAFPTRTYESAMGLLFQRPKPADLTPVGIAAHDVALTVSHLELRRDIYYRAEFLDPVSARTRGRPVILKEVGSEEVEARLHELAGDPRAYAEVYGNHVPWTNDKARRFRWLPLGEDEFLMLGDNSPRSSDSRLWRNRRNADHRHAVPRENLVGKALLIFWPHGHRIGNVHHGQPHGWQIPFLEGFFYHQRRVNVPQGPDYTEVVEEYPTYGVPFYPNFERILRRIR